MDGQVDDDDSDVEGCVTSNQQSAWRAYGLRGLTDSRAVKEHGRLGPFVQLGQEGNER